MKVAFFSKEYPPYIYGGVGIHIKNLTAELAKCIDIESRYFSPEDEAAQGNPSSFGFSGHNDVIAQSGGKFKNVLDAISINLMMVEKNIDAELVHAHTWYGNLAGFWAKELYGLPLVSTVHSLEPLRPWKREQLGNAYNLSLWMEKTGIENSDRVLAVSKEMRDDILKHFTIPEEKVTVLHNGIDLNKYKNRGKGDALAKYGVDFPYILFVGRLSRQKGITVLIDAMERLKQNMKLVILASSPDTPEIENEVAESVKGKDNIVWINKMLPENELIQFYSNASLFACPSIYEPFGIINLEAMACNVPVVASAVGGIKEVVVDGETGLLVSPDKPQELADAMDELLGDKDMCRRLGENGRRRVETMFSWESIAKKLIAIYEDILKK